MFISMHMRLGSDTKRCVISSSRPERFLLEAVRLFCLARGFLRAARILGILSISSQRGMPSDGIAVLGA
jgi:hypothetical protein